MAISWYDSLKDIPWSKALSMAPSIADRGKKLWSRLATRDGTPTAPATPPPGAAAAESLSALEIRCHVLESRVSHQEVVASFEVVQALAEQHSEMVPAVELLLARTRVLLRVCALLGVALVALLILTVVR